MAINDLETNFMVHMGIGEDGCSQLEEMTPKEVKDLLGPWTKGSQDTDVGNQSFVMMSPVDECKKGLSTQYHIFVHPFKDHDTHVDDETEFYEAVVHAATLMSQEGRVWTKALWTENKNATENVDKYPLMHALGYRNPVFCAFQVGGFIYGFSLNEDNSAHYAVTEGVDGLGAGRKRRLKQRKRVLKQVTATANQNFQDGKVDGLKSLHFKKAGFANYREIGDITVANLQKIISNAKDKSYA